MALVTFLHEGANVDYTPSGAVSAGAVILQGSLIGVAKKDIAAAALGALAVEGVFLFPKATGGGAAIAIGVPLYWDVADSEAKADAEAGANKLIGKCVLAAADADTTVCVKMNQ